MSENDPKVTLSLIKKEVHKLDEQLKESDDSFKTAVVMLAALHVGTSVKRIVEFTGLSKEFVKERATALRANGIWKGGKVYGAEWFEKDGSTAFCLDVLCAQGMFRRTKAA